MKTPIEVMLERVQWRETGTLSDLAMADPDVPWATHEGVLEIGDAKLRCYRLSNGQAILNADDVHEVFGFALSAN